MTQRQARILTWFVLLPLTIAVWVQFLPPCMLGCARVKALAPRPAPTDDVPPRWDYVICPFAPPCWKDGRPIRGAL